MSASRPNLSKYVLVSEASARGDRIWLRVADRLERPRHNARGPTPWVLTMSVALVIGLLAGLFLAARRAPTGWAQLETAGDVLSVKLQDGSQLTLERHTRLELRESSEVRVALELDKGHVDCDVTPNRRRAFAVAAGGFEVLVSGTRFGVDLSPERQRLEVDVRDGSVSVQRRGRSSPEAILHAGQRWAIDLRNPERAGSLAVAPSTKEVLRALPVTPDALPVASLADAGSPPSAAAPSAAASPSPVTPAPPAASRSARHGSGKPRQVGARLLLDQANAARRAGDIRGAARAFELLLTTYPNDPRSGLAAFELGRLRMDRLGDVRGAVAPLQAAQRLVSDPGLREDAMARLVRAFDSLHQKERCLEARGAYLEAHPTGVHVGSVAEACEVNEK